MVKTISVIVPCYNEEKKLKKTLKSILKFINKNDELIIINDASKDNTLIIAKNFKDSRIKIINNKRNKGKGYSVKKGIMEAKGDLILFSDADLSTPVYELNNLLKFMDQGYDIIIGSRGFKKNKIKVYQPIYRIFLGKFFNIIVQILFLRGIKDTQCGFKLFKKDVAKRIFKKQKINGFCFDVEILYLAKKMGYNIKEVPVEWINNKNSKVHIIKDSIKMLFSLIKIIKIHGFNRQEISDYYLRGYFNKKDIRYYFYHKKFNKIIKNIPSNQEILDMGCANGVLLHLLKDKSKSISGIDINEKQIQKAKLLCKSGNFYVKDIKKFNLKKKFDIIICTDVLEHFNLADIYIVLSCIQKHLKKDGFLYITYPSSFYLNYVEPLWKFFRKLRYPFVRFSDEKVHNNLDKLNLSFDGFKYIKREKICFYLLNYIILKRNVNILKNK